MLLSTCNLFKRLWPSGTQTWLAGKSLSEMELCSQENHRTTWKLFQLAMFHGMWRYPTWRISAVSPIRRWGPTKLNRIPIHSSRKLFWWYIGNISRIRLHFYAQKHPYLVEKMAASGRGPPLTHTPTPSIGATPWELDDTGVGTRWQCETL